MIEFKKNAFWERFGLTQPFSLSQNSTIGCGGIAQTAFYPTTLVDTIELLSALHEKGIPFYVVGCMSNVLPSDEYSNRVFVCTKKLTGIEDNFYLSGMTGAKLLTHCKNARLGGLEFLEGIPCTLGGALFMNAGVQGAYIGDLVESVTIWQNKRVYTLTQSECAYAYKSSVFMQNDSVILGAKLRLGKSDLPKIESELAKYRCRRAHLPKGKSMGCVFKNPQGEYAGKLIEGAGLKGYTLGGACISEVHANFIINKANATAKEIKSLITLIKNAVYAQYKILLEEEIRYLE